MIDINEYLASGIIESHCLGTTTQEEALQLFELCKQYPEVQAYYEEAQITFEGYLRSFKKTISPALSDHLKESILNTIKMDSTQLSREGMLSDFIDISKADNFDKLESLIKGLHPPTDFESVHVHTLYAQDGKELHLVWVKDLVPMEEHPHLDESFLVLEGTADCNIDGVITKMKRGDYMRIPPESHHEVVITSPTRAKAIQSRITLF